MKTFALSAAMLTACAFATAQQQPAPTELAHPRGVTLETVKVYLAGKDATMPELIPKDYSPALNSDCERTEPFKAKLQFIVAPDGAPHDLRLGMDADANGVLLLIQLMRTVKFRPAQLNGSPVAVGLSDNIQFDLCYTKKPNEVGKLTPRILLHSAPQQEFEPWKKAPNEFTYYKSGAKSPSEPGIPHVGGNVKQPVVIYTVDPQFSDEARSRKIQGAVIISMIVDATGKTQDVQIVKPAGYGLDDKAVEAVKQYRFKPATKDGKPVAVYLTVVVNFRLT